MQLRRPGHTHKFVVMVMSGGGVEIVRVVGLGTNE